MRNHQRPTRGRQVSGNISSASRAVHLPRARLASSQALAFFHQVVVAVKACIIPWAINFKSNTELRLMNRTTGCYCGRLELHFPWSLAWSLKMNFWWFQNLVQIFYSVKFAYVRLKCIECRSPYSSRPLFYHFLSLKPFHFRGSFRNLF